MGLAITPLERPIHIGKRLAKNRFMIQPLECGDADLRGNFSEDTLRRYESFFQGGAGVVVMESVTLQTESRARKTQLLLDVNDPDNRDAWERFMIHKRLHYPNTILIVQLNHSGELSDPSFSRRICVKPYPGLGGDLIDEDYIEKTIDSFVEASHFLYSIGVDGVDLKFCHGYLGSQLLRPFNDRSWKYGGSFENRTRFAFELCEKVRRAIPDESFLAGAKVSMYDEIRGGQGHKGPDSDEYDLSESIALCKGLEDRGANFFIESLGSAEGTEKLVGPDHAHKDNVVKHLEAAKQLKRFTRPETTVICGGLSLLGKSGVLPGSTTGDKGLFEICNRLIEQGDFDMIALGRQMFADPATPLKYTEKRCGDIRWCACCGRCGDLLDGQVHAGCALYDPQYKEAYRTLQK